MPAPNQDPNKELYDRGGQYRDDINDMPMEQKLPILPGAPPRKSFEITGAGNGSRE